MIVIDKEIDIAGKYRVLVQISNERAIPLKFQEEVTDEIAFAEAQKILDFEAHQQAEMELLAQLEAEEKQLLEELSWLK